MCLILINVCDLYMHVMKICTLTLSIANIYIYNSKI